MIKKEKYDMCIEFFFVSLCDFHYMIFVIM